MDVLEAIVEVENAQVPHNERAITDYFGYKMPTPDPNEIMPLDLVFMSTYDKNFGFRYNIDSITGIQEMGKLFQVLACVCPPASPY